jgi:hypothetical protein
MEAWRNPSHGQRVSAFILYTYIVSERKIGDSGISTFCLSGLNQNKMCQCFSLGAVFPQHYI